MIDNITNIKSTIIKTAIAVAAFILLLSLLPGCSSQNETANAVSASDLQAAMLGAAEDFLPEMTTVNSDSEDAESMFSYLSDLDYDKVDGFFLSSSSAGLADEIAVIIVKDASDVSAAEESLNNHVMDRVNMYSVYLPDQTERAEHAVVGHEGNYVYLIISDDSETVKTAFLNTLGN